MPYLSRVGRQSAFGHLIEIKNNFFNPTRKGRAFLIITTQRQLRNFSAICTTADADEQPQEIFRHNLLCTLRSLLPTLEDKILPNLRLKISAKITMRSGFFSPVDSFITRMNDNLKCARNSAGVNKNIL